MKRSGRILLCLACGVALNVIAQAENAPTPGNPNGSSPAGTNPEAAARHAADIKNRIELLKKKFHGKNPASNFPSPGSPASAATAANSAPAPLAAPKEASAGNAQDNPYASIPTRNVFGLNPPTPEVVITPQGAPPPKITLQGITTIFGPAEALYKAAGVPQAGKPPKDQFYILHEGEGQDDIIVQHIDVAKGIVTFNNHGEVQKIPLTAGVASGGSPAPSGGGGGGSPAFPSPRPTGRPNIDFSKLPPDVRARFEQRFGNSSGLNQNNNTANTAGQYNYNNNNNKNNGTAFQNPAGLSGDDQAALIAAQHAAAANNPNSPVAPGIFPPTKFDQDANREATAGAPMP